MKYEPFIPWSKSSARPWTQKEVDAAERRSRECRAAGDYRMAREYQFTADWARATQPGLR